MSETSEPLRETLPETILPEPFVRYVPETGRIDTTGEQSVAANKMERLNPPFWTTLRLLPGSGEPDRHYVVPDADGVPQIVDRPASPAFDRTTLGVGEGASIPDLPACRVRWTGPITGSEDHPGGDYELGWTVPGTYVVDLDPFPAQPFTVTFTVED